MRQSFRLCQLYTVLSLMLMVDVSGYAQPTAMAVTGSIHTRMDKASTYRSTLEWIDEAFRNTKDMVLREDKEAGIISMVGYLQYKSRIFEDAERSSGLIRFTMRLTIGDSSCMYEIRNFEHSGTASRNLSAVQFGLIMETDEPPTDIPAHSHSWNKKVWKDIRKEIKMQSTLMMQSLEKRLVGGQK